MRNISVNPKLPDTVPRSSEIFQVQVSTTLMYPLQRRVIRDKGLILPLIFFCHKICGRFRVNEVPEF